MSERESGTWSRGKPLSRALAAPVRAMNRFLGTADGRAGGDRAGHSQASSVVDCAVYAAGQRLPGTFSPDEALRVASSQSDAFVWLGLHEPAAAEMSAIAQTYGLHELAVEDAVKAEQRPKLNSSGRCTSWSCAPRGTCRTGSSPRRPRWSRPAR